MSWQTSASRCREADETTSYVLVEAQYQDDLGEGDLSRLCGQCPVAYECLTAGVRMYGSGVWGGLVLDDGRPAPPKRHGKHSKAHLARMNDLRGQGARRNRTSGAISARPTLSWPSSTAS